MPTPNYAIEWDKTGERLYETGTDRGVLYVMADNPSDPTTGASVYPTGVAWNGLTAVTESPEGAEPTDLWADNIKYLTLRSAEQFKFTIEAYTYPDEFCACNGETEIATGVVVGQQARKTFGICYRSVIGNDVSNNDHGYKLHLIYGATCSPSEKAYATINDSPEAITFSWEATSTPVTTSGISKPVYQITIDSTKCDATDLATLEGWLYGTAATQGSSATPGYLPLPSEIMTLFG